MSLKNGLLNYRKMYLRILFAVDYFPRAKRFKKCVNKIFKQSIEKFSEQCSKVQIFYKSHLLLFDLLHKLFAIFCRVHSEKLCKVESLNFGRLSLSYDVTLPEFRLKN